MGLRGSASGPASRRDSLRQKRSSLRNGDSEHEAHPYFTQALQELEGDLVILGGYRGSVLRSAEPPHRQLWVPIKVGLNLRKVDLEVPLDPDADERMHETIIPLNNPPPKPGRPDTRGQKQSMVFNKNHLTHPLQAKGMVAVLKEHVSVWDILCEKVGGDVG